MASIAEVEAAVRSVLAREPAAPVPVPAPGGELFAGRLLAVRHVEALPARQHELRVAPGTVVTPLARDLLKQRGIALRQGANRTDDCDTRAGEWGFAIEDAAESGLTAALRRALVEEAWSELEATPGGAARWVAEDERRGALVVADEASVAVWRACQVAGVRAAAAADLDVVARAVRRLGINLLVVEPPGKSISWLRQLASAFRRAGAPVAPEGLEARKEGCACGSPR
jgi:hypothetical protein